MVSATRLYHQAVLTVHLTVPVPVGTVMMWHIQAMQYVLKLILSFETRLFIYLDYLSIYMMGLSGCLQLALQVAICIAPSEIVMIEVVTTYILCLDWKLQMVTVVGTIFNFHFFFFKFSSTMISILHLSTLQLALQKFYKKVSGTLILQLYLQQVVQQE